MWDNDKKKKVDFQEKTKQKNRNKKKKEKHICNSVFFVRDICIPASKHKLATMSQKGKQPS